MFGLLIGSLRHNQSFTTGLIYSFSGGRLLSAIMLTSALALPLVSRASLWESQNWAATGLLEAETGYDSNLTLSSEGNGSYFVQATPTVEFLRRNSSTDLRFIGSFGRTEYFDKEESGYDDVRLRAKYAYPLASDVIPSYSADATWASTSEPNAYLGRRAEYTEASLIADGYLPLKGKLGLRGNLDFKSSDYKNALNQNTRFQSFIGLGYKRTPTTEISLNIGGGLGRSKPPGNGTPVESTETYATIRIRGSFTPKVSGSVYGGIGQVDYQGGYDNSYGLPVAGADVTWGIDPRRTLVFAAYSGADYTPDGQSVRTTRAFVSYTNVIVNRWEYAVRGGPSHSVFSRESRQRTDNAWEMGADFSYKPSDRFRVSVGVSRSDQDSDVSFNQYERTAFNVGSSYRF